MKSIIFCFVVCLALSVIAKTLNKRSADQVITGLAHELNLSLDLTQTLINQYNGLSTGMYSPLFIQ